MSSDLESAFLLAWRLYAPDAPEPIAEARFDPDRRWRFDFAWFYCKVAVEIDGGQWQAHGGRHNTDADRDKLNHAAALGWRVLRFSASMLRDPQACVRMVREAIGEKINDSIDDRRSNTR